MSDIFLSNHSNLSSYKFKTAVKTVKIQGRKMIVTLIPFDWINMLFLSKQNSGPTKGLKIIFCAA